jgi:hypothetical protein
MPSTRYTVRLPPALDAAVQERLRTAGTPFAVLIREALSAYLADTPPTGLPTPADSADTLRELQEKLADVTTRVKVIEEMLTTWPQFADTPPTDADISADRSADTAPTGRGQRKLTPRQQRALRDKYQRGVSVPALMDEYGISRASVFRYLQSAKR